MIMRVSNKSSFFSVAIATSFAFLVLIMLCRPTVGVRVFRSSSVRRIALPLSSTPFAINEVGSTDILMTGLNEDQDISVKVVSCTGVLREAVKRKSDMSPQCIKSLGEVIACTLMMGSGLKGDETLQISMVGNYGLKNIIAITDGTLKVRGMVGTPEFSLDGALTTSTRDLLGEGQIQVVRNHPSWKQPMNGIVELQDTDLVMNLALYMAQSEQRSAAMLSDVQMDNGGCVHAIGVLVECLPGATEANIDKSIKNLEAVRSFGLSKYLGQDLSLRPGDFLIKPSPTDTSDLTFEDRMNMVVDDCLLGMGESIRWSKTPQFQCTCGIDRVWRVLKLLPKDEIVDIVSEGKDVELKCGFCGKAYSVTTKEITDTIDTN